MSQLNGNKALYLCAAECIIEKEDGKILTITRPQGVSAGGLLAFPGGGIEYLDGEIEKDIFKEAAKREVFEEVGIKLLDQLDFVTSSFFFDEKTKRPVVDCIFHCLVKKTDCTVIPNEREVPHYQWLTREEIKVHPLAPKWVKHYVGLCKS